MPFVDHLFRQGHLSDDVLAGAIVTGDRPAHLDHCASCAARAMELGRWLDNLRTEATAAADAAFPAERLALQHAQILRRIEQIEEPVRVLEFPKPPVFVRSAISVRRVSAGWIGVAAAAGLALGVVGGHMSARIGVPAPSPVPAVSSATEPASDPEPTGPGIFDADVDSISAPELRLLDENTPRIVPIQYAYSR